MSNFPPTKLPSLGSTGWEHPGVLPTLAGLPDLLEYLGLDPALAQEAQSKPTRIVVGLAPTGGATVRGKIEIHFVHPEASNSDHWLKP